jgi:hypothetical protein
MACAQAYRCVNRSTEIAPEDEKRLMIQCITKYVSHAHQTQTQTQMQNAWLLTSRCRWARSVDGMLTLKEVQPGVSGDHATEEGEGGASHALSFYLPPSQPLCRRRGLARWAWWSDSSRPRRISRDGGPLPRRLFVEDDAIWCVARPTCRTSYL